MARVLITDDAAFMKMMLKDILIKGGYDVVGEAINGADAIEKYKELKPDLVTLDITMPEMDGISACQGIMTLMLNVLCVQQWGNKLWFYQLLKPEQKILLLNLLKPKE